MKETVDIIVVTFNRLRYIKNYIGSLYLTTKHPFRIFVVDNGSSDGTREFLIEMKEKGLIYDYLFTEKNLPLASAYSACFNKFKDELNELIMTSADDHTPPLSLKCDWLDVFVRKIKSDDKIGTINFRGVRSSYDSVLKKIYPILNNNQDNKIKLIKEELYKDV